MNKSAIYWDQFYDPTPTENKTVVPSQFAAFSLLHMLENKINLVLEFGCGSGRDTRFFLNHGQKVIATDQSPNALVVTKNFCDEFDHFFVSRVDVTEPFLEELKLESETKALYARFLLHSLQDSELKAFIKNAASIMNKNDFFYVEYRTSEDKNLSKFYDNHFRNFLSERSVRNIARQNGLIETYCVKGLGFAKWKNDDAFVCRQIFTKSP